MTTYLLIKSAESNHVTSVAVYDGGIGMKYNFAEAEARRINAAIDKAASVDAAIAAAVSVEREACAKVALSASVRHGLTSAEIATGDQVAASIAAAIRARGNGGK